MSMTHEEIEAAREQVVRYIKVMPSSHKAFEALDALVEAAKAAQPAGSEDYVAWLRWSGRTENRHLVMCDSDADGAFRVYRWPSPTKAAQPEDLVGRRVLFRGGGEAVISGIGYKLDWLRDNFSGYYDRTDFVVIEPTGEKESAND